jgi:predicted ferric reductase
MPSKNYKPIIISLILLSTLPFFWLLKEVDFSMLNDSPDLFWSRLALVLANICGFIGISLIIWEIFLGIRFLASLLTEDLVWLSKVHKWIGKYGMLLVLIHPLLELYVYLENWVWLFLPDLKNTQSTHITYGRVAFILLLIIYFSSILLRKKLKYRPWLYIHYLTYPILFFSFLHALDLGTFLNQYVALKAWWFTMMAMFFILLIYRALAFWGVINPKFVVIGKFLQTPNLLILTFRPTGRKLKPKAGQYLYLQIKEFGESHPFSLMEYNPQTGDLTFGIGITGKFTEKLKTLEIGDNVRIDGAYGIFGADVPKDRPTVIIAGSVGITPFVEFIKQSDPRNIFLLNCNRKFGDILLREDLRSRLGKNYLDFISDETVQDEHIINSQIKLEYLQEFFGENLPHYQYMVCGSPGFIKAVKGMLSTLKVPVERLFTEEFSF